MTRRSLTILWRDITNILWQLIAYIYFFLCSLPYSFWQLLLNIFCVSILSYFLMRQPENITMIQTPTNNLNYSFLPLRADTQIINILMSINYEFGSAIIKTRLLVTDARIPLYSIESILSVFESMQSSIDTMLRGLLVDPTITKLSSEEITAQLKLLSQVIPLIETITIDLNNFSNDVNKFDWYDIFNLFQNSKIFTMHMTTINIYEHHVNIFNELLYSHISSYSSAMKASLGPLCEDEKFTMLGQGMTTISTTIERNNALWQMRICTNGSAKMYLPQVNGEVEQLSNNIHALRSIRRNNPDVTIPGLEQRLTEYIERLAYINEALTPIPDVRPYVQDNLIIEADLEHINHKVTKEIHDMNTDLNRFMKTFSVKAHPYPDFSREGVEPRATELARLEHQKDLWDWCIIALIVHGLFILDQVIVGPHFS